MTLPNHIAGGLVFTGVFGGIAGINILESPALIATTVVGATIADMDLPHSLWGRVLGPISRGINRRFGHRTITHSLLFMIMIGVVTKSACKVFEIEGPYPSVMLLAFFSHLLFDMMTVQGVPILYPYRKNPCVIPADPNMRFNGSNRRSELAIFGFFVMSGLFLQPLMRDGFWTSYNRLFGTIQHLQSEFEKSEDLLLANYRYREASNEYEDSGYVIEAAGDYAVLWDEREGWIYLDGSPKSSRTILEIIPEHTGQRFEIVRESFVNVDRDSLEAILRGSVVYQVQLSGNRPFRATYGARNGNEQAVKSNLELELVNYLNLAEVSSQNGSRQKMKRKEVRYQSSPRIKTLGISIRKLRRKAEEEKREYQDHQRRIQEIEKLLAEEQDIYEATKLQKEFRNLQRKKPEVYDYAIEIAELEQQIEELRQLDREKYRKKREEADAVFDEASAQVAGTNIPLRLTGIVTLIEFAGRLDEERSK